MEKSELPAGLTTKVTVVVCVRLPLVPVIVSVKVPVGVFELVETLIVLLPEPPVTGFGLNVALTPDGRPLALRVTLPVKLPEGVKLTL